MSIAFNLALHVLLVGSLLIFLIALVRMSLSQTDPQERILRVAALLAGAMVTLGAQAAGVSYANFTVKALAGARPASGAAEIGATIIPGLFGVALGFYIVRVYKRSERIAARVMGFVGMLAVTAFAEIYATATHTRGVFLGAAALPNVSFVTGIILCVIFTYDPDAKQSRGRGLAALASFMNRRGSGAEGPSGSPSSSFSPFGFLSRDDTASRASRRDPFSD